MILLTLENLYEVHKEIRKWMILGLLLAREFIS